MMEIGFAIHPSKSLTLFVWVPIHSNPVTAMTRICTNVPLRSIWRVIGKPLILGKFVFIKMRSSSGNGIVRPKLSTHLARYVCANSVKLKTCQRIQFCARLLGELCNVQEPAPTPQNMLDNSCEMGCIRDDVVGFLLRPSLISRNASVNGLDNNFFLL